MRRLEAVRIFDAGAASPAELAGQLVSRRR